MNKKEAHMLLTEQQCLNCIYGGHNIYKCAIPACKKRNILKDAVANLDAMKCNDYEFYCARVFKKVQGKKKLH